MDPELMWPFFKNKSIPYNLRNEIFAFYLLQDRPITE